MSVIDELRDNVIILPSSVVRGFGSGLCNCVSLVTIGHETT